MFGPKLSQVVFLDYDPAADDDIPLFVAPERITITAANYVPTNALAGSTANYFDLALYNGGTAGTALTAIAGTVGGTVGYSALTPVPFTITNGTVAAGEVVKVRYNEEGTGTFTSGFIQLDYVLGVG